MFEHHPLPLDPIRAYMVGPTRFYETPGGHFPSVTTVIGAYKGTAGLDEWRARVGEEEARKVGGRARVRGTAVHEVAERYLLNEPDWASDAMPSNLDSFLTIKPILDRHVGKVFAVEAPLWSDRLRTAGRTDLLAEWDGVPSIIDFKTSLRVKKEGDIWGYFIQKSCYGAMVEERLGQDFPRIVTVMMVDHEPPQVFVKERSVYHPEVVKIFVDAPRDTVLDPATA